MTESDKVDPQEEQRRQQLEKATYSARDAHSLKTKINVKGKTVKVQFKNGVFNTTDQALIVAFDEALASNAALARMITKVDREAAEKLARQHLAERQRQGLVARGSMSSDAVKAAQRQAHLDHLASQTGSVEIAQKAVDEMRQEGNYAIPEPAVNPDGSPKAASVPSDGFVAGETVNAPAGDATSAVPEGSAEQAASAREVANKPTTNPFAGGKK